jgi:hypothetical protein
MKQAVVSLPHSWSVETWPSTVYPHDADKARYLIRSNRDSLTTAGALVRVGRNLVVMGASYSSWLQRQGARVANFDIAPNVARKAAQVAA